MHVAQLCLNFIKVVKLSGMSGGMPGGMPGAGGMPGGMPNFTPEQMQAAMEQMKNMGMDPAKMAEQMGGGEGGMPNFSPEMMQEAMASMGGQQQEEPVEANR